MVFINNIKLKNNMGNLETALEFYKSIFTTEEIDEFIKQAKAMTSMEDSIRVGDFKYRGDTK